MNEIIAVTIVAFAAVILSPSAADTAIAAAKIIEVQERIERMQRNPCPDYERYPQPEHLETFETVIVADLADK
jgi:hypothetical protein